MKSFRITAFLAAAITAAAVSSQAAEAVAVTAAPSAPTASPKQSIDNGLKWLLSRQSEDGAFSNPQFPGISGLAVWAIAASGDASAKDAVKKGSDYILSKVQPDGGIYSPIPGRKGGGLSTYNTAVCLTALAATGRDDITKVVLDARTFLASSQNIGDDVFKGGFGYDKSAERPYADLMNTHFVVEAMRRTQHFEDQRPAGEKRADIDWDAALAFAETLHNGADAGDSAGGFAYSPADAKAGLENADEAAAKAAGKVILRSYGSITYAGLLSLLYCQIDKSDSRVQSTLDWAARHWSLEENPGMGDQGLYFFYNVISRSMSVLGAETIARKDGEPIKWANELAAKVASLQHEDGSWTNKNGRFWENDPVLATAYSLLALEFATGVTK